MRVWNILGCLSSISLLGILKYLQAQGFQKREYAGLTEAPQDRPLTLKCLSRLLVPKCRARQKYECVPSSHPTPPHPTLSSLTLQYQFFYSVTENRGEVEIKLYLNCSHRLLKDCQWQAEFWLVKCM